MKKSAAILASLAFCILTSTASDTLAFNSIGNSWRAQYPAAAQLLVDASNDCTLCHLSNTKNPRNPYGATLEAMSITAAEPIDSDGDGQTNGDEILLWGTLPGDMASADEIDSWGAVKVLFR